jgi:ATP-dependent Clp protease protease subunit
MKKKHQHENEEQAKETDKDANPTRNVYVFGRLENDITLPVIKRLLKLNESDPQAPINMFINSSGGNGYNADGIIAIMHSIEAPVNTICLGHALSGACEILASGTGDRLAYEYSTLMFHQTLWEAEGDITNLEIQAQQGRRFRQAQVEMLHKASGKDLDVIAKDIERDFYLSPSEAFEYGLIDGIIPYRSREQIVKAHASKKK